MFLCLAQAGEPYIEAINGVGEGHVVAHTAMVRIEGLDYRLAAVAVGEQKPQGGLEGVRLHWACSGEGGPWQQPPVGWHTLPALSKAAGLRPLQPLPPPLHCSACSVS